MQGYCQDLQLASAERDFRNHTYWVLTWSIKWGTFTYEIGFCRPNVIRGGPIVALRCRGLHIAAGQGAPERPFEEMPPHELQEMLERVSQDVADDVQLIDVREDFEHQTASLPGFKLMPMSRQGAALL